VRRWKETEYPRIAAAAKAAGGTVFFVDEAGCAATITPAPPGLWFDAVVTTW